LRTATASALQLPNELTNSYSDKSRDAETWEQQSKRKEQYSELRSRGRFFELWAEDGNEASNDGNNRVRTKREQLENEARGRDRRRRKQGFNYDNEQKQHSEESQRWMRCRPT